MRERWSRFTASCWRFFGVGSFWPIFFTIILICLFMFRLKYYYSQDEIDEMRRQYESEIEAAREDGAHEGYREGYDDADLDFEDSGFDDGYHEGYQDAELDHESDWSDGYSDGFYDGYYFGYADSASGNTCDPFSHN